MNITPNETYLKVPVHPQVAMDRKDIIIWSQSHQIEDYQKKHKALRDEIHRLEDEVGRYLTQETEQAKEDRRLIQYLQEELAEKNLT